MKIKEITDRHILFDDGSEITDYHEQNCCEYNYADYKQLDDIGRNATFYEPLDFEFVDGYGFRFGNQPRNMYFIPCYSEQNGYYVSDVEILYNKQMVCSGDCELIVY